MIYIISLQFILIIAGAIYIGYLKIFKKYTRERFAFTSMTIMSTTILMVIAQLYSAEGYISSLIRTSTTIFDAKVSTYQTDWRDHILTIILVWLLGSYLFKLYQNWDGPISVETREKQRFNQPSSMILEAHRQLMYIFNRSHIEVYAGEQSISNHNVFSSDDQEKLPWHIAVQELLSLSSEQYDLNLNGYYQKESCFIGTYGIRDKLKIAVFCSLEYPKDSHIREFISFVKKIHKDVHEYIIAVKNLAGDQFVTDYQGTNLTVRNEEEMLGNLINFEAYFRNLKNRFTSISITDGGKHFLEDIYVPLKGKDIKSADIGNLEAYILEWTSNEFDRKHLAILGEYGCGKSVISLKVAYEMVIRRSEHTRIPILIELRGKSPRTLNMSEILAAWGQEYHINAAALMKLHKAGKTVLIFEGFDEMDMVGDRDMRQDHFQHLWEFAMPKSKIIITGRPNFFLDDKELRENLGLEKISEDLPYCEAIYLEKFDMRQIKEAMRNIDVQTREQVLNILEQSGNENFYDLVSRPAILYLVAVIWKDRKLSEIRDKINSAIIISEFIIYSYSRQTGKKILFPLSEKEREYFMIGIAVAMVSKSDYTNQIHRNDLEHVILSLYKVFPTEISDMVSVLEPRRKALTDRMVDGKAEETIMTDVRSCGILTNDLTRKDYFKFAHKSFLEYLVSLYFTEALLQDKGSYNIIANAISKSLGISISNFTHSQETIAFTSEILITKLNLDVAIEQEQVARKLFRTLYPIKILGKFPKLVVSLEFFLNRSTIMLSLLLTMPFVLLFGINNNTPKEMVIWKLILMSLPLVLMIGHLLMRLKLGRQNMINNIWVSCCLQLKIDRKVLEQIVPFSYLNFLLAKSSSSYSSFLINRFIVKSLNQYISRKRRGNRITNLERVKNER